jgi:hypothetical protein
VYWRPSTLTTSELSVERADGPDRTARHHVTEVLWIVVIDKDSILLISTIRSNGGLVVLINPPTLAQTSCRLLILVRSDGIRVVGERSRRISAS